MSETAASLGHTIASAQDLQSVVRTMKALAASSVGQYEQSVRALADYHHTVQLGLGACFRESPPAPIIVRHDHRDQAIGAVVFGSDQGLVGRFNDDVADFAITTLASLQGKPKIWAVGERVHGRLADAGLEMMGLYDVPNAIQGITPLVGRIQVDSEAHRDRDGYSRVYVFHNRPKAGSSYDPVSLRLLPLDQKWRHDQAAVPWPTKRQPQIMGEGTSTLRALIREYLFISLFRASAESLASENASRLAAMQRAEKNIDDLLVDLKSSFRRQRQGTIDEELFDVIAGFEALKPTRKPNG